MGWSSDRFIADRQVSAVVLGGMSWSFSPSMAATSVQTPDERGLAAIHAAVDSGITMIDTAYAYTTTDRMGHSESLIARALASHPDGKNVRVATKGGHYRQDGAFLTDASRDTIRRHCEASLELLGIDRVWLYQLHWPDPNIPVPQTMATFAELKDDGLVENVGVSNFSLVQLEEARRVVDIASVQNRFTPSDPRDRELAEYCQDQSIAYLVYSPLRRLRARTDGGRTESLASAFPTATSLAEERGVSTHRLLLAWMLGLSDALILITGASWPDSVRDSALASELALSPDDSRKLDSELRPIGRRTVQTRPRGANRKAGP